MDDVEPNLPDVTLITDSVAINVAYEGVGGVQLCPAIILGSPQALPSCSKHMYSRLAASANQVDEGMPDIIISLVSNKNQISKKYMSSIKAGLSPFVTSCGVWFVSSGEYYDPLARAAAETIKIVLPQTGGSVEVIHLMVNSANVIGISECKEMVDTSLNTMLIASRKETENERQTAVFRGNTVVRLSHPPPALLIGVPSEHISTGMTPSTNAPPILLSPSNDKRPLPMAVFAGASLSSLEELVIYVENGVPVVILQDSCELCAILHNASLLYCNSSFEHGRFEVWLRDQLNSLGMEDVEATVDKIVQFMAIALGEPQLVDFIEASQLSSLASVVVDLCLQAYSNTGEARQVFLLGSRLNQTSVINAMMLDDVLDDDMMCTLLCESVAHEDRIEFLSSILELRPHLNLTPELLIKMSQTHDQHFFHTIVLSQCMGYSTVPDDIDDSVARDLNKMLKNLSCGIDNLFPSSAINGDILHKDNSASLRILAVWSLLLNKPRLTKCFCSFSEEPLPFSLILSRIARSLAHEAHDYFFYEDSLLKLADELSSSSESVLNCVYEKQPEKAYQMLCQPVDTFNSHTVTQIAFQSNCRRIVSHESCQRWVHRLLYGHLQARNTLSILPKWLKIALSALFIFPIRCWISIRPLVALHSDLTDDRKSPTVALLDVTKQPRRTRAVSTYSVISGRSDALTNLTLPMSVNLPLQVTSGADSATPQSMVFPLNIEDADGMEPSMRFFNRKTKIRRWSPPSIPLFYSTPIVKYWLHLIFRLLHIFLLAYTVILPGCGSMVLDAVAWCWTFMAWVETIWTLYVRSQNTDIRLLPWRVFDCAVTLVFLTLILMLKVFGDGPIADFLRLDSIYPAKVISAFFLLYWCYATLFFYIPLSDIFGPLMVRIKLMILRDFTNFLIMISLIMATSAAAIHATLYPDKKVSPNVIQNSLSWVWLSIFTTDLSSLKESDTCRKSFLGAPKSYCSSVSEYGNSDCPAQGWPAYLVIIEYFVLLKLILWPILFALFAKTAKAVDEEADKIWKYQLYSLAIDFSIRPPLPPPLTPLFFIFIACCRGRGRLFSHSYNSVDHPDIPHRDRSRSTTRFGAVYRNPSVPHKKNEFFNSFWRQMAIDQWKKESQKNKDGNGAQLQRLKSLEEKIRMLNLTQSYQKTTASEPRKSSLVEYAFGYTRIVLDQQDRPWNALLPRYSPPFYCKPNEEFPIEVARFVETATEQNVCELRRGWRSAQLHYSTIPGKAAWRLSSAGFPLNPNGRQGIAGRGNHARFGANKKFHYIIVSGVSRSSARILLDSSENLPSVIQYDSGSRDEFLASLLKSVGLADTDSQVLAMKSLDQSIISEDHQITSGDTSPAHLSIDLWAESEDTDNAWTEHHTWGIALRSRSVTSTSVDYHWTSVSNLPRLNNSQNTLVEKAIRVFAM